MRDTVLRLMDDVHLDRWYGNPFQYLLDNWEKNTHGGRPGVALVEAANETYGTALGRSQISDLAVAHDCWVNIHSIAVLHRHTELPMDHEEFMSLALPVLKLLGIGVPVQVVKEACRKEAFSHKDSHITPKAVVNLTVAHVMGLAQVEVSAHEAELERQDDLAIREHEAAFQ